MEFRNTRENKVSIEKLYLFLSNPIRNPASPSAARKLPLPASFPVTAYSLTKAWKRAISRHLIRINTKKVLSQQKMENKESMHLRLTTWRVIKMMTSRENVAGTCINLTKKIKILKTTDHKVRMSNLVLRQ